MTNREISLRILDEIRRDPTLGPALEAVLRAEVYEVVSRRFRRDVSWTTGREVLRSHPSDERPSG